MKKEMTCDDARKTYSEISDLIFDVLCRNGGNEDDEVVTLLRKTCKSLEDKYGFYFGD